MEIVKILLENGASVNERGWQGQTPLMAAAKRESNVDMLQLLLGHGAEINYQDKYGNTALMEAISYYWPLKATFLLEACKDKNISINAQNDKGMTALMFATVKKYTKIVKQMIELGADVNIKDRNLNTALLHVVTQPPQSCETLTTLINAGSDVCCQNDDGESVLMLAANYSWTDGAMILLDSGADVNAVSEKNSRKTALTFLNKCINTNKWVYDEECKSCFEAFLMKGASLSYIFPGILQRLTLNGDIVFILKLIKLGLGPTDVRAKMVNLHFAYNEQVPVVSPLCLALLKRNGSLARFYMGNLFLTKSDITSFTGNHFALQILEEEKYHDCQSILNEFFSYPWSIFLQSFVSVLSAVGSSPGRENRVNMLPLPQHIKAHHIQR